MFIRSSFHHRQFTLARLGVVCALLLILALAAFKASAPHSFTAGAATRQQLSFEDRVAAQRAIEEVYHQHRIWPTDNPQPKPPLDAVLTPEAGQADALRAKVEDALRLSTALEVYWQRPVTAADLQAEVDRMARDTRQPDLLRELWAALGNDPLLVAECLARPLLAERLVRMRIEDCGVRNEGCEALGLVNSANPQSAIGIQTSGPQFEEWWRGVRAQMEMAEAAGGEYRLPEIAAVAAPCGGDAWTAMSTAGAPAAVGGHTAVWTGSEMIVWGGGYTGSGTLNTGGRYNPATDSWTANITTTGAPSARFFHSAVWTGSEMIVWGGNNGGSIYFNTGGRYNPATNSWTANITTAGAPSVRDGHSAIWTGSEMIVWGGYNGGSYLNTGGRYNPATDSWPANITTNGAPIARYFHSAVWTGSEMIVWGGYNGDSNSFFNTGGRYNPTIDSWTTNITTAGAPAARYGHSAIWTGSEMIVLGGGGTNVGVVNTGGRYNLATDSWATTTTTGAPSARYLHSAVWIGSEMIVWGGISNNNTPLNTGGRY